jgi:hypothetical protein
VTTIGAATGRSDSGAPRAVAPHQDENTIPNIAFFGSLLRARGRTSKGWFCKCYLTNRQATFTLIACEEALHDYG